MDIPAESKASNNVVVDTGRVAVLKRLTSLDAGTSGPWSAMKRQAASYFILTTMFN